MTVDEALEKAALLVDVEAIKHEQRREQWDIERATAHKENRSNFSAPGPAPKYRSHRMLAKMIRDLKRIP